MLQKFLHFLKYNNATIIILAIILILGAGAYAAGPEAIGQKQTSVQGVDNAALLSADLGAFNLDFKVENIEQDEKYYYASYSFLDLVLADSAWQYQLSQKTVKISKKVKDDLGAYLAKYLAKHYEARIRELKREKSLAQSRGEQRRVEVVEYSGLIGRTLDLASKVFPGYEPVMKRELPAPAFAEASAGRPDFSSPLIPARLNSRSGGKGDEGGLPAAPESGADNLTRIYNEYVAAHPEVFNPPAVSLPNPPADETASSTPAQTDPADSETPAMAVPETLADPAIPEPANVDIIELPPTPAPDSAAEPAPATP